MISLIRSFFLDINHHGINFEDISYFEIHPDRDVPFSPADGTLFSEYQYTLDHLPQFMAVSIKLVMESSSSTIIPRIKDFAVIALDA